MPHRKASYRITVVRREALYVGDEPDHSLMLTEMEGAPIKYEPGVAGKFVSRRSVGFHDRRQGAGPMMGYAITTFEDGAVYSRFDGKRDAKTKVTTGTWKTYKGTGKLKKIKGSGTFTVKAGKGYNEFVLDMEGDYTL
jgi:hypothetical protein